MDLARDLALLHALGVKLVIVHDADGADAAGAVDEQSRDALIAAAGLARSRLESHFSALAPLGSSDSERVVLVGANLVGAKPRGVADGVDQRFAGEPRRIAADEIGRLLDQRCIVLLPPFGYSNAGEAYALSAASLAAETALAVGADKLIIYDAMEQLNGISQMSPSALAALLEGNDYPPASEPHLAALLRATQGGVARGHLISYRADGALLRELFTAEGVGTQISEGDYRTIRPARVSDIPGILELIRPLEDAGLLVRRPRNRLEAEVGHFHVAELDGIVIGCCALYPTARLSNWPASRCIPATGRAWTAKPWARACLHTPAPWRERTAPRACSLSRQKRKTGSPRADSVRRTLTRYRPRSMRCITIGATPR